MSKKGKNYLSHKNDLFAYLLGRSTNKYFYQTFTGITLSVDNTLNAPMKIKLNASEMSQNGTPTPESPQDIHTISGDNKLVVNGKNLANITIIGKVPSLSNGKLVSLGGSACSDYISIDNTKEYTFSFTINNTAKPYILFYGENNSYLGYYQLNNSGYKLSDSTYYSSSKSVILRFDQYDRYNTIQLEYGNQATPYTPFVSQEAEINLGDIEYCKIGNYEDKIFKNIPAFTEYDNTLVEGAWYIKKNIGKVVLDGSENFTSAGTSGTDWRYNKTMSALGYASATTNSALCNSNYFVNTTKDTSRTWGTFYVNGNWLVFYDKNQNFTNVTAFNNWLSTHNTIVYYVLETPTYTQITGTLAEQLENIYQKLKSFKGTTNISQVNNDLPFILHCEIAMKNY
jgi:hypothetical protein